MKHINKMLSIASMVMFIGANAFAFIPDYPYGYGLRHKPYTSVMEYTIKQSNADPASVIKVRVPLDDVIEAVLRTGGSYTVIQDAKAQEEWANLMLYLGEQDPNNLTEISLPFNFKYYGLAKSGKQTPSFLLTPSVSGVVTVSVDHKNSFIPNIKVDGVGLQEIEGGLYKLTFRVTAGRKYRVTISDNLGDNGLYLIVANIKT